MCAQAGVVGDRWFAGMWAVPGHAHCCVHPHTELEVPHSEDGVGMGREWLPCAAMFQ